MPDPHAISATNSEQQLLFKVGILFVLLAISSFASSSETALFSLNRFELRRIKERFSVAYKRIRELLRVPSRLLVLILILNECVNLTISSIITSFLQQHQEQFYLLAMKVLPRLGIQVSVEALASKTWVLIAFASICITTPILLVFGEITPKIIAARLSRITALINISTLYALYRILYPIIWTVDATVGFFLKGLKNDNNVKSIVRNMVLSEEDFLYLAQEGIQEGSLVSEENKLIQRVLDLDDTRVSEIMTPIDQVFSVSASLALKDILAEIRTKKYSRIPVYQKSKKHIIGVLYLKDLLWLQDEPGFEENRLETICAPAFYVSPKLKLSSLFLKFKESKVHMAICVDDHEQAMGIVTMEDVLECIFGEIELDGDSDNQPEGGSKYKSVEASGGEHEA